jgi:hypothetical protein
VARGLTHPTAYVDQILIDFETKEEYIYKGFLFDSDIEKISEKYIILRRYKNPQTSGAIFLFEKDQQEYGIIYYCRSCTAGSKITAKKLGMDYTKTGPTSYLNIQSSKLVAKAPIQTRKINDIEVACAIFKTKAELKNIVIDALKDNIYVSNNIVSSMTNYLNSDLSTINWNGIKDNEQNEIGKYLGELVIGAVGLDARNNLLSRPLFNNKIKEFVVPVDSSFPGIDSVFTGDETLQISSKYSRSGARASFFPNLLPKFMNKKIKESEIKKIVEASNRARVTKEDILSRKHTKNIVYEFGIRDILNLSRVEVSNCYAVFNEIKKGVISASGLRVINSIQNSDIVKDTVKEQLPFSLTSAFSREISRRLNLDDRSIEQALSAISNKNFYQITLNKSKWQRGEVFFDILPSREANILFVGNKSAISDIDARMGTIGYKLTYS